MRQIQRREEKKKRVMNLLKENKLMSTSAIALKIKSDQNRARDYLEELLKERKIKKTETPIAIYWKIK